MADAPATTAPATKADLSGICIGLVGPLPPLRGGISLYVQRLASRLTARGARVVVLATNGGTQAEAGVRAYATPTGRGLALACARIAASERIDLLHFHTFGAYWKEMLPFVALQRLSGVPVIVSQHSFISDVAAMKPNDTRMLALCVQGLARVVTSGPAVLAKLLQAGARREKMTAVVPFIAPPLEDLTTAAWPADIAAIRQNCRPIIASGTGRLDAVQGRDLYGLDQFVQAARSVLTQVPDAGFVYLIGAEGDAELLRSARAYVLEHGLQSRVCIHVGPLPGPLMWQAADVYVRPTLDDGDAVSIREAMYLGVPTVASDVVGRPVGCLTYRGGDAADLARVLLEVASDLEGNRKNVAENRPLEAVDDLVAVYLQTLHQKSPLRQLTRALAQRLTATGLVGHVARAVQRTRQPS